MANRTKVLSTLDEYFNIKGRVLKAREYALQTDTPIRLQQVRNIFGTWNKMEKLMMARREAADTETNADDVIALRNAQAWAAMQAAKSAEVPDIVIEEESSVAVKVEPVAAEPVAIVAPVPAAPKVTTKK